MPISCTELILFLFQFYLLIYLVSKMWLEVPRIELETSLILLPIAHWVSFASNSKNQIRVLLFDG